MMAAEVKRLFEGRWVCYKAQNEQALHDKIDTPQASREVWLNSEMSLEIFVKGANIRVDGKAGQMCFQSSFILGQDYKVTKGLWEMGNVVFADGVLTTVLTRSHKSPSRQTITREIVDGNMLQIATIDDVVATRYFKKTHNKIE